MPRSRRRTIIALSILILLAGGIAYTIVSLDTLVAGIVENRLNRNSPGRFKVHVDRLRLHSEGGIAADTIILTGTDPNRSFQSVTISRPRVAFDISTILRRDTPPALTSLQIDTVTVRLRSVAEEPPSVDSLSLESLNNRVARVETAVFQALAALDAVPTFETKVSLERGVATTLAEGTFTLNGSTVAVEGTYEDYTLQLRVSDAPRTIEGTIRRPGTLLEATATMGSAAATFELNSLGETSIPFGLDRYISRVGGAAGRVTVSFTEVDGANASSVLQPLVQPIETLLDDARFNGEFTISDTRIRYDNEELPPELTISSVSLSVSEEDGILRGNGAARLQNGASLDFTGVSIPVDDPWESSFSSAALFLPPDTPVPTGILPDRVAERLLPLMTADGDGYAPLPEVSIELSKPMEYDPIVGVIARIERPGRIDLTTEASIDLEARRIVDSTTDLTWRSIAVDDALWWEVTGRLGLSAPFEAFSSLPDSPFPPSISGRYEFEGTNTETEIAVSGRIEDGTIRVSQGAAVHMNKRYVLDSGTTIRVSSDRISLAPTPVAIGSGRVVIEGENAAGAITGALSIERVPISWFLSEDSRYRDTTGFISGDVSFQQSGDERPEIYATLWGEELSLLGTDGTGRIEVRHDTRGFEIVAGSLAIESLIEGTIDGRLPLAIGPEGLEFLNLAESTFHTTLRSAEFERFFPPSEQGLVPSGRLEIDAHLEEQTGDLRSTIRFLVRTEDANEEFGVGTAATGFGYERLSSTIRLRERSGDRLSVGIELSADDESIATVSSTMTIPGLSKARPTFDPKDIDWEITGASALPLEYISPFVPGVIAMTGQLRGAIDVGGTVGSPTVDGSVSIEDGELRLSEPIPPISALSGTIRFDGETYRTETFSGETGLAPFTVDISGRFPSDDLPGSTRIRVDGDNVLLASTPAVRLRAATNVEIVGSNREGYTVGGTISVTEGIYSQDIPLIDFDTVPRIDTEMLQLFSVDSPLGEKTDLDLHIRSNAAFRVDNNIYKGPLSADLTLGGTLSIPQPEGRVFTDRGTLQLPLTTITVQQGSLQFPADAPFSPIVRAQGSAQIRDYRVTAIVSGQLPGVEINLSSTPPLSQSEALVLLSTGLTPRELSESGNRTALTIGSRLGTQFVRSLVGTSGGDVGSDLADRVSVILGEGVSESGEETIEIEFRLSDEDSWFLVFRRDRFERYNLDLSWRFWLE